MWTRICKLEPGGHKLFREENYLIQALAYAIADDSGSTPDKTDDGPLYLDFDKPLRLEGRTRVCVSFPVTDRNGKAAGYASTGIRGGRTLLQLFPGWTVRFDRHTKHLAEFFALMPSRCLPQVERKEEYRPRRGAWNVRLPNGRTVRPGDWSEAYNAKEES